MKLIYIATSVIPARKANSYQVMKMGEAFTRKGLDVELLIPVRFGGVRDKGDPFEYYGIATRFKIRKIFSIDLIPLEKVIGHIGFWIQNLSFSFLTLIYTLFVKSDIIYSRDRFTLLVLCLFKKNLVFEVHSLPAKFRWYEKFLYRRVRNLVVITNQMKKILIDKGVAGDKVLVASDAVDLEKFDAVKKSRDELRNELDLPKDKKLISYVGGLRTKAKEKGVADIIRAYKILNDKNVKMVFVGGEKESVEQYKGLMLEIGLEKDDAIFIEHVPFNDVPRYEKAMDILVMPFPWTEHYAYYMSPLKMFEYMACKVPIVTTDLPTVREILDEESAVFVKPGEPASLASGFRKVLESEEKGRGIALDAYEKIKKYTWDKRADNILRFIK
ncbi:glycosyltransferase family 4 protein [Candidatus Falkowbacteria bacterium]|nr:glycosyltransferase family 4 protein [Candidatus Falkowbacteria bacterium]